MNGHRQYELNIERIFDLLLIMSNKDGVKEDKEIDELVKKCRDHEKQHPKVDTENKYLP